jgi:hypothetical protein
MNMRFVPNGLKFLGYIFCFVGGFRYPTPYWYVWFLLAAVIHLFGYFLNNQGQFEFWRLVSKNPSLAYIFFCTNDAWKIFENYLPSDYLELLPKDEWVGPFHLKVPNVGHIYIFGKVGKFKVTQKIFERIAKERSNTYIAHRKKTFGLMAIVIYQVFSGILCLFFGLILLINYDPYIRLIAYKIVLWLLFGILLLIASCGLWFLREWGRKVTFWLHVFSIFYHIIMVFPVFFTQTMAITNTLIQLSYMPISLLILFYISRPHIKSIYYTIREIKGADLHS